MFGVIQAAATSVGRGFQSAVLGMGAVLLLAAGGAGAAHALQTPDTVTFSVNADADGQVSPGDQIDVVFEVSHGSFVFFTGGAIDILVSDVFPGATIGTGVFSGNCNSGTVADVGGDIEITGLSFFLNCTVTVPVTVPEAQALGLVTLETSTFTGDTWTLGPYDADVTVEADTINPTVTLTGPDASTDPFEVTARFDEPVDGLTLSDFTVSNGTAAEVDFGEGGFVEIAVIEVTPTGGSPVTIQMPAGAVEDEADNGNDASNLLSVVNGVITPDVELEIEATDDPVVAGDPATFEVTITNNSATETLTAGSYRFDGDRDPFPDNGASPVQPLPAVPASCGGSATAAVSSDDVVVGSLEIAALASCTITFQMNTDVAAEGATYLVNVEDFAYTLDGSSVSGETISGTVVIGGGEESGTVDLSKTFTDDPVEAGDTVTVEYTILSSGGFTATDLAFTDDLDAALSGLVATGLPQTDVCGAGSSLSGTDTITLADGQLGDGASCTFSVTLQTPGGAAAGDYTSTTSALSMTRSDLGATSSPAASDDLSIFVIASGAPTVTVSADASSVGANEDIDVDIRFDQAVTGFEISDLDVANGVASNFSGTGAEYSVTLTAGANDALDLTIQVPADSAENGDTDGNEASNLLTIDIVPAVPEISISQEGALDGGPFTRDFGLVDTAVGIQNLVFTINNVGTGTLTMTGATPVTFTGTNPGDFSVASQPTGTIAPGGSLDFTVQFDPAADGARAAVLNVASDDADEDPFLVNLTGTGGAGPEINVTESTETTSIPTGTDTTSVANGTDFGNLNIGGATSSSTFVIQNLGSGDLTVSSVGVSDGRFTITDDPDGTIAGGASSTFTVTFDPDAVGTVNATVSINSDDGDEDPYTFNVTGEGFDADAPSGYTVAFDDDFYSGPNLNVTNASFTLFDGEVFGTYDYTISSSGGGTPLTGTDEIPIREAGSPAEDYFTGLDLSGLGDGTLTVSVTITDPSGNEGAPVTDTAILDTTAPTVDITTGSSDPVSGAFTATLTFSEDVTGFAVGNITVGNGAATNFQTVSASEYTATITPAADGAVTVDVAADVATDDASNGNTAATQFSIENDETAPTVAITTGSSDPVSGAFTATFTFSEDVTGFAVGNITVGNGAASNFQTVSASEYTATITPAADGTVTVDVNAAVAQDDAGNDNTAAPQFSIENDETAPTVAITTGSSDPVSGAFTATFTFSEAVTGFAVGNITVGNGAASNFAGSGDSYTATITPAADGTVTVDVNAAVAQDAAGNDNTAATQFSIENDETAPTVAITTGSSDPVSGAFTATFTFSEDVTGFALGQIDVGNGAASNFGTSSASVYTATITPAADGTVTVDVDASVAQDDAGNDNTAAPQFSIENDETAPTVAITTGSSDPVSGAFTATFTFSEDVTGFALGNITVGNGAASNFAGSGDSYTATITPAADGTVTVDVNAAVAQDAAGNDNTAATQFSIENDETAPTVAITTGSSDPVSGAFTATFTFSEDVTGFALGQIDVGNGAASNFAGSGDSYTATITPAADGTVTVDVDAGAAQDDAGNDNTAAPQFSIENDETAPTVAITTGSSDPVSGAFTATFTFSEDVTGFALGNITVGNGAASNFGTTSASVYTATITPAADGTVTVDVNAAVAQDGAGNDNTAATQFSIENDETAPTVAITTGTSDPTSGVFQVTFTFSEDVTGFSLGGITVGNGSAGNFAGSGDSYTADITPASDGTVTVDVNAAVAQDAAGNDNTAATQFSIESDSSLPSVVISSTATDPVSGAFDVTFTFSEDVTGFALGDITVGNGAASNFGTTSASVYTATITPAADGTVTVDVAADVAIDDAANGNTPATQFSITNDESAPTVAISTGSADPVSGAFTATFTFSEDVTGFALGNITVGNGAASNFGATSASVYTATITPAADGTVTIDVNAGVAQDGAGNDNTAATQFSIENDETAPTVAISTGSSDPVSGVFQVTFTFSEDVTGFNVGGITVGNGSAGNFAGSGDSYTADITPAADGTVTVDVNAAVAQDAAGNDNTAATQFSIESDGSAPTVAITSTATDPVSGAFGVTFTFSEDVTGFALGDIDVGNGTASNFGTTSASVYTATITPAADGSVTVDVAADVAIDAAANGNTAATQFSIENDESAPSVVLSSTASDPVSGAFTLDVVFSEDVTGLSAGEFSVGNGAASGLAGSGDTYTLTITPAADGTVTVDLPGDAAQDGAGNGNTAASQFSIENDETAPSVALSSDASDPVSGAFTVTATFSEAVTGFDLSDFTVGNGSAADLAADPAPINASGTVFTALITPAADGEVTVDIAADAAQDAAGNGNSAATQFSIDADATAPTIASITPLVALVSELQVGTEGFSLAIDFGEAMDTSVNPTVGFDADVSGTLTFSSGSWSGDGMVYTALYDVADNNDDIDDIGVNVSGATDAAGNVMDAALTPAVFGIDMPEGELRVNIITNGGDARVPVTVEASAGVLVSAPVQRFLSVLTPIGALTVTAETPDGYVLESLVCEDPDDGTTVDVSTGIASIDMDNRESIVCTYTYQGQGGITITGVANDENGDFDFTGDLGAFTIAADADGESRAFSPLDAGVYEVTLEESDGFEFNTLSCDAGVTVDQATRTATIDLAAGDAIECEFEQTAVPNLVVENDLSLEFALPANITNPGDVNVDVPLGNTGAVPLDFLITVDVPWITIDPTSGTIQPGEEVVVNFALNDQINDLEAGDYSATITITRAAVAPNESKGVSSGAGSSAAQVVTVPVTLTVQPRRGTVQLVATTAPMAAGDESFGYASDIAAFDDLTLTTVSGVAQSAEADLLRGTYTVTQSLPDGWRADSIECSGDTDGGNVVDLAGGVLTIDLDPDEAMVCTFANVRDEAAVVLATQRAIRNFMVRRADRIIESQPELSRRLDERTNAGAGGFAADATEGRWTMSAQASLSGMRREMREDDPEAAAAVDDRLDVWMRAEFSSVSDDRAGDAAESDFGILHVGADVRVAPNLLLGAMAARDWASEGSNTVATHLGAVAGAEVEGEGWLAGPYAVYEFDRGGVFDIRALWGGSNNRVNPLGLYEDDFDTERFLIQANLSGEWVNGAWRVRPTTGLTHYEESQLAYTDSLGILIPGQDITIGRFNAGPEIAYRFEGGNGGYWEPSVRLNAIWDYDPAQLMDETGALVGTGDFRANARLGLTSEFSNGARLTVDVSIDGLGEGDFEATSGGFRFRFPM